MQKKFDRIVFLIVLITAVLMFTGLSSTSAAMSEKSENSCCNECNKKDEGNKSDHCSTPACPVFLCLSMNIVTPFTPLNLSGSIYMPQFAEELLIKPPAKTIFHPPTIS